MRIEVFAGMRSVKWDDGGNGEMWLVETKLGSGEMVGVGGRG